MQRQLNMPIDDSAAAGAASWCAEQEDLLIFYGDEKHGYEGLMTHPQRNRVALSGNWDRAGAAFRDAVAATEVLFEAGHYGPYAMVASPRLYANLHRIWEDARTLEIDNVRRLLDGGLFRSDVLQNNSAVVVSTGRENMDIAVGLDMTVAYLGAERMNHPFRVLETIACGSSLPIRSAPSSRRARKRPGPRGTLAFARRQGWPCVSDPLAAGLLPLRGASLVKVNPFG